MRSKDKLFKYKRGQVFSVHNMEAFGLKDEHGTWSYHLSNIWPFVVKLELPKWLRITSRRFDTKSSDLLYYLVDHRGRQYCTSEYLLEKELVLDVFATLKHKIKVNNEKKHGTKRK